MKYRNIIITTFMLLAGFIFTACTNSEETALSAPSAETQNGFYVYHIDFNCEAPGYDVGTTRAVTYSWPKGTTLFARFKNGNSYYQGFVVYEDYGWDLVTTTNNLEQVASGTCELYYFQEANGDYYHINTNTQCFDIYNNGVFVTSTGIAWNTETISLTEGTAVYATTSATYSQAAKTSFSVNATLKPMLWRLRFKGPNGSSVTLLNNQGNISLCSAFNWSASSASFSKSSKDVYLTVSGGYTPYVYGEYYNAASNEIAVQTDGNTYTRILYASDLPTGTSGYFDIPTESDYSSKGWTKAGTQPTSDENWTWDYDGSSTVWGNMGYCGGSGEEVGKSHFGEWWGVTNEAGFLEQLVHTNDGKAHGDESMNAYFTLGNAGDIIRYAGNGKEINRGVYSFDYSVANSWKVANLYTTPGTILFPYEINSGGNMPSVFEVVYYADNRMCLVYPDGGNFSTLGSWGEATYWHFRKADTNSNPTNTLPFDELYLNWGASKSTVKTNRANNGYVLDFDFDSFITYQPKYWEENTMYSFDTTTGGLYMSSVHFAASTISFSELVDYVKTDLGAIYDYTSDSGTVWFTSKDGKCRIFVSSYSSGDLGVTYTENWNASPSFKGDKKAHAKRLEQLSAERAKQASQQRGGFWRK